MEDEPNTTKAKDGYSRMCFSNRQQAGSQFLNSRLAVDKLLIPWIRYHDCYIRAC